MFNFAENFPRYYYMTAEFHLGYEKKLSDIKLQHFFIADKAFVCPLSNRRETKSLVAGKCVHTDAKLLSGRGELPLSSAKQQSHYTFPKFAGWKKMLFVCC